MWLPSVSLSEDQVVAEFDQWVTPSLGDLRDTNKFAEELDSLEQTVRGFADALQAGAADHQSAVQAGIAGALQQRDSSDAAQGLNGILTALFLATAKSDNALKCQFPLWFRSRHGDAFPRVRGLRVVETPVPTVLKSTDLVKTAIAVKAVDAARATRLVAEYVDFLMSTPADREQIASLIDAYTMLERSRQGSGKSLLSPLVSFQVRGSVAASGGHDPELIVRRFLVSWGLLPGVHFNMADLTAGSLSDWLVAQGDTDDGVRTKLLASNDKTRAFDFVLPARSIGAQRRIFIQSQFYAGDSGSVSHKNVDQAGKARAHAATLFRDARFVELVDGAGYCGSLRKDLRHLLFASDTEDFVQLRSIPIRLRRLLQESNIVTPLDIALRVAEGISTRDGLASELSAVMPAGQDVGDFLNELERRAWLTSQGDKLAVAVGADEIVQEYKLLDDIVARGRQLSASDQGTFILVPGFGPDFGMEQDADWSLDVLDRLLNGGHAMKVERS